MRNERDVDSATDKGEYVDVFNYMIHYREKGDGEPLLMIHGLGQCMYTFRKNIDELSRSFRVIAVDLPGHGRSDKPEIDYTIDDFTEALVNFLGVMKLDKVHVFAFSTGAVIALNMAAKHPEMVDRMILISPGGITPDYPLSFRGLAKPVFSDVLFSFGFSRNACYNFIQEGYFDRTRVSREDADELFKYYKEPAAKDALITALRNWEDHEVYSKMRELTLPIYVFWGECDKWHPLAMMDELSEMLPYAYIATVRNSGHMVHEEKSREINRKTIECLTEPLTCSVGKDTPPVDENLEKIKKSLANMTPESVK